MFRYQFVRRLALALALPATFVLPLTAVAHGVAHEDSSEAASPAGDHASGHHHEAPATDHSVALVLSEGAPGSDGRDHAHPDFDATVTSRGLTGLVGIITAGVVTSASSVLLTGPVRVPLVHPRVRAHGTHAPPPSLRSPPGTIA